MSNNLSRNDFKTQFTSDVHILVLTPGDDVLKSIQETVDKNNIINGIIVSGIGSLAKARYHIVEPDDTKICRDEFKEKEGAIEIISISGVIANSNPHLHINMSQEDEAFGGHLEEGCEILTVSEIVIASLTNDNFKRELADNGVGYLNKLK